MRLRPLRVAAFSLLFALVLGLAGLLAIGEWLVQADPHPVGDAPASLNAQTLRIPLDKEQSLAAWFATGQPGAGAVLLVHGIRSDRRQMLGRAQYLAQRGVAVLLIDLPAHGESDGQRMQFGKAESAAVRTALDFLQRQLPDEKIGVIGISLGAASTALALPHPGVAAVVLESMFATLQEATANRMQALAGQSGPWLTPLLLWQLPLRFGFSAEQIRPIDKIAELGAPVLIASGTADPFTPWAETLRLFAAAAEPKQLLAAQGAAHVDLYAYDPAGYEAVVFPFLMQHLRQTKATAQPSP